MIPEDVYDELDKVSRLNLIINNLIKTYKVKVVSIIECSKEPSIFDEFTYFPKKGKRYIGKGEAACLALAISIKGCI